MQDLTLHDISKITGRHIETLRRLARVGALPGVYRIGGRWMVRVEALDQIRGKRVEEVRS
jgi:hypothetical protein